MPETQTLTLTDFLLARIAEDERAVEMNDFSMAALTPRALAECEAKRRIVAAHRRVDSTGVYNNVPLYCDPCQDVDGYDCEMIGDRGVWPCETMKALALPYAYHPDFRAEWAL